jgi:serine protease
LTTHGIHDELYNMQWSLEQIHARDAWEVADGSAEVKVAIVDNAVRASHEDLVANRWVNLLEIADNQLDDDGNGFVDDIYGYDVADDDNNPEPPVGSLNSGNFTHGTHCAGIAAASTGNATGIASIGNGIRFISVKCTPDTYTTNTLTESYAGVDYAIAAGADIISMSFGSTHQFMTWNALIDAAAANNILMIAAAGNNDDETIFYPAGYDYVLAVGSTTTDDSKSSFSSYGSWVDVMAPGSGIYSTLPESGDTYGNLSGTSMACPLVAGLLKSTDPEMSVERLKNAIASGCENIDAQNPEYVGKMGAGRINAYRSIQRALLATEEVTKADGILKFYPNPNQGNFTIRAGADMNGTSQLTVFNQLGQNVYQQEISLSMERQEVPVQITGLSKGLYTIRLANGSEMQHATLVIE